MKMTKEAKIWVEQEKLRHKSCLNNLKRYAQQIELIEETMELERQQMALIIQGIEKYKTEWDKA
jgi:hypothetical protein